MESNLNFSKKAERDYKLVCIARENKDQKTFGKLMNLYERSVYYMLLKMTHNNAEAQDLTLKTFEKAFRKLSSYEPEFSFSTWLFRIATNNCIDFIRRKKKVTFNLDLYDGDDVLIESVNRLSSHELNPEEQMIKEERINMIHQIVGKLKPLYKKLVDLYYFKEMGCEEISDKLHMPLGTVKAQLFRARKLMYNSMRRLEMVN